MNWHRIFHEFTAHWHYNLEKAEKPIKRCKENLDVMRPCKRCCICGTIQFYTDYIQD